MLQQLKAWSAAPPRLRSETEAHDVDIEQAGVPSSLVSTALSSQDDPQTVVPAPAPDDSSDAGRESYLAAAHPDAG